MRTIGIVEDDEKQEKKSVKTVKKSADPKKANGTPTEPETQKKTKETEIPAGPETSKEK